MVSDTIKRPVEEILRHASIPFESNLIPAAPLTITISRYQTQNQSLTIVPTAESSPWLSCGQELIAILKPESKLGFYTYSNEN